MTFEKLKCPHCGSADVVRKGRSSTGKQRYMCRNPECRYRTFQMEYERNLFWHQRMGREKKT